MTQLSRPHPSTPTNLLQRILERPGLITAVRELPGAVLGALIERIGLEDAAELVALATREQLERIFDDDLWRAERPGGDELFRPERFALWVRVMLEAGDDAVVRRLCELPVGLVALGVHRLVLVLDADVIEEQLAPGDEQAGQLERALEDSAFDQWEELRLLARDPDAWEDVWNALVLLDRDHHDRLRAILEACCDMSMEYISGQGGLFNVLTADETPVARIADWRKGSSARRMRGPSWRPARPGVAPSATIGTRQPARIFADWRSRRPRQSSTSEPFLPRRRSAPGCRRRPPMRALWRRCCERRRCWPPNSQRPRCCHRSRVIRKLDSPTSSRRSSSAR